MKKYEDGFTVVELLIVIVVIATLATISVTAHNGIQSRARDVEREQDMTTVQKVLAMYYTDHSSYPDTMQLRDPAWRAANLVTADQGIFVNPQAPVGTENSVGAAGSIVPTHSYSYYSFKTDNSVCAGDEQPHCVGYALTWRLEKDNQVKQVRIKK